MGRLSDMADTPHTDFMIEQRVKQLQKTIREYSEKLRNLILEVAPHIYSKMKNEISEIEVINADWRFLLEQHELYEDSSFNNMISHSLSREVEKEWFVDEFESLRKWTDLHWFDLLILLEGASMNGVQQISGKNLELAYLCCRLRGEKEINNWLELLRFWGETQIRKDWISFIQSRHNEMKNDDHLSKILEKDFFFTDNYGEFFTKLSRVRIYNNSRELTNLEVWGKFFDGSNPSSFSELFKQKDSENKEQFYLGRRYYKSREWNFCSESILEESLFDASWDVLIDEIGSSSPFVESFIESYFSTR